MTLDGPIPFQFQSTHLENDNHDNSNDVHTLVFTEVLYGLNEILHITGLKHRKCPANGVIFSCICQYKLHDAAVTNNPKISVAHNHRG